MSAVTKPVIHVGVDGSWRDTGALEWALQESLLRQAPLRAMHVVDERLRQVTPFEPEVVDDWAVEIADSVQKYLDESPGDHEAGLLVGPPAQTLVDTAADSRMLVVGRRGLGTLRRLLIGSTSEAVVARAARSMVPVVIVPDHWTPSDHAGPVMVALDDDESNAAPLEFAIAAAEERKVPVRILHVGDLPADEWRQKYPEPGFQVDVRRGHVVDGVVTAAGQSDAQLLVVGSHHHTRLASMLLGSVTRGVLHHAVCPLAVVPA